MLSDFRKSKQILITATSTDIGKTFFVTELCKKFKKNKIGINAIKPLISGFDKNDNICVENSDIGKILSSLGKELNSNNIDSTSLYRLKTPISIPTSAKIDDIDIDYQKVVNFCKENINHSKDLDDWLLIEAAGGVMSPISNHKTFLDLATDLNIPIILLSSLYLGTISHTLCCLEAFKSRSLEPLIIFNENSINQDFNLKSIEVISEIKNFTNFEIILMDDFIQNNYLLNFNMSKY